MSARSASKDICNHCGISEMECACIEEDDEVVSVSEVYRRARVRFGNTEEADEAARLFPGDFI